MSPATGAGKQQAVRTLSALARQVESLSTIDAATKAQMTEDIEQAKDEFKAYERDVWFYRIVVGTLGSAALLIIVAVTVLLFNNITGFDALTAIGSAAIGGLVGLLAPSPVGQR